VKKYFVEVTVGIYMDEMDDENTPESVADIADRLVYESISGNWNDDIVTTVTAVSEEIHPAYTATDILGSYATGGLDSLRAEGVDLM